MSSLNVFVIFLLWVIILVLIFEVCQKISWESVFETYWLQLTREESWTAKINIVDINRDMTQEHIAGSYRLYVELDEHPDKLVP